MAARSQQAPSSVWWMLIHSPTNESLVSGSLHQNGSVECYPGDLPSISGMNVRWVLIAEEHQNRDPVEGADPRHGVNISVRSDRFDKGDRMERINVANLTSHHSSHFQV